MNSVLDIANFFIETASDKEDMTNLRVNKLTYLAQGWSLATLGRPLFEEDFEAWKLGPVAPSVYNAFKQYGKSPIEKIHGEYDYSKFQDDEINLLVAVFEEYEKFATSWLITKTHENNAPWKEVYVENKNNKITKDSIRRYFSAQKPLKLLQLPTPTEDAFIGWRNEEGRLILPEEEDDGYEV